MKSGERTLRLLLAPIAEALADPTVTEVVVNQPGEVGIERHGRWSWANVPVLTFDRLDAIAILAGAMTGQDVDPSRPLCSTALPDGQRLQVCRPAATLPGTISLTMRKPSVHSSTVDDPDFPSLFALTNSGRSSSSEADAELLDMYHRKDWRSFFRRAVLARKTIAATGSTGSGKAQPLDAKVLTPTGWRRIGDLKVSDMVTAADGTCVAITGTFPQGVKEIYRVHFEDGRYSDCCNEHLWKVWLWSSVFETGKSHNTRKRLSSARWSVETLSEIRQWFNGGKAKALRAAIPVVTPFAIEHPPQDLPLAPYALGALLGDGCFGANRSIYISSIDTSIIDRVEADMPDYKAVHRENGGCEYRLIMRNRCKVSPAYVALINLGLAGCCSHEKFVPVQYKNGSVSQRVAMMQGLMDTDGSVANGTHATFTSTSLRLAKDVQEIAWSLGAIAKINSRQTHYSYKGVDHIPGKKSYRVSIVHPDIAQFFSLPRKVAQCKPKAMRHRLGIVKIEHIGKQEAVCIAIDHPEHLYITDNYVVTHNTHLLKRLIRLVPAQERLVTIEDTPEFGELPQHNRVALFYSAGDQGQARLTPEDLLKAALRMRPDRIPMQELRGAEAFAFLRALAAGHPGAMTSWHAEEGQQFDALGLMVRQHPAGASIPDTKVRALLMQYLDIIVWCKKGEDGFSAPNVWFKAAESSELSCIHDNMHSKQ